jgi:hypothetical protein
MIFEYYFSFLFYLVIAYVVIGNYIYFRKVIPTLNTSPSLLPSSQSKHIKAYVDIIIKRGENPWFLILLKNIKTITLVIVILMIPAFLHVFGII